VAFPDIDPIIFQIGPFALRWYALAYLAGLIAGWRYMRFLAKRPPEMVKAMDIDDFLTWAVLGVIVGGRLGYVLFYQSGYYLDNPLAILKVWQGGMSFHGGLLGVTVAGFWFVRHRGIAILPFADLLACVAPIGIFLGRIANFINGELFGRATDVPWAIIFPRGGPFPRHPSQLYEATLEGLVLFIALHILWRWGSVRLRPGLLTGVFLSGYAAARLTVELFRQPDAHLGFFAAGTTMGQWLSVPMLAVGLFLMLWAHRMGTGPESAKPENARAS